MAAMRDNLFAAVDKLEQLFKRASSKAAPSTSGAPNNTLSDG